MIGRLHIGQVNRDLLIKARIRSGLKLEDPSSGERNISLRRCLTIGMNVIKGSLEPFFVFLFANFSDIGQVPAKILYIHAITDQSRFTDLKAAVGNRNIDHLLLRIDQQ